MNNDEPANAESQGLSLCIKWIKQNKKEIKLLMTYSGRQEHDYGYIYQATNWDFVEALISPAFYQVDDKQVHQFTLYLEHKNSNSNLPFYDYLKYKYKNVVKIYSKQFLYLMILDKKLKKKYKKIPYPKEVTDAPVVTKTIVLKGDDSQYLEYNNKMQEITDKPLIFYYDENELLFSKRALIRRGELEKQQPKYLYAKYNLYGQLEQTGFSIKDFETDVFNYQTLLKVFQEEKFYKNKYFMKFDPKSTAPQIIKIPIIAIIDDIPFYKQSDIARYLGVSRQAISQSKQRNSKQINGKEIKWIN